MGGEKKSDSIEVRVPHGVKQAFMARCRAEGRSASAAIRAFVEAEIAPRAAAAAPARSRFRWPVAVSGMAAAALAVALMVGPASVSAAPDFGLGFAALDRDHDGMISPAEFGDDRRRKPMPGCGEGELVLPMARASVPRAQGVRPFSVAASAFTFAAVDRNQDGRITREEYAAHWIEVVRKGFTGFDRNHDGSLDRREYAAVYKPVFLGDPPDVAPFLELDADRDGKISWDEFIA